MKMTDVLNEDKFVVDSEQDLTDYILEESDSIESIFQEYVQIRKESDKKLIFCFYEGKEDLKYYPSKIKNMVDSKKNDSELCHRVCNGKKNVVDLFVKIRLDTDSEEESHLYFVDKDFDRDKVLPSDFFVTPSYSIENFYANVVTLDSFLLAQTYISPYTTGEDKEDYIKLREFYENELLVYLNSILNLNAVYSLHRQHFNKTGNEVDLKNIKTIKKTKDCLRSRNLGLELTVENLKEIIPNCIDINDDELQKEIDYINIDIINNSRGKYIAEFLNELYSKLIDICNNNANILSKKRKISINVSAKTILDDLAAYAFTPNELLDYLDEKIS